MSLIRPSILVAVSSCVLCPSLASILLTFKQIATALIHLLEPAVDELGSPCLAAAWGDYVSTPRLVPELLEP